MNGDIRGGCSSNLDKSNDNVEQIKSLPKTVENFEIRQEPLDEKMMHDMESRKSNLELSPNGFLSKDAIEYHALSENDDDEISQFFAKSSSNNSSDSSGNSSRENLKHTDRSHIVATAELDEGKRPKLPTQCLSNKIKEPAIVLSNISFNHNYCRLKASNL